MKKKAAPTFDHPPTNDLLHLYEFLERSGTNDLGNEDDLFGLTIEPRAVEVDDVLVVEVSEQPYLVNDTTLLHFREVLDGHRIPSHLDAFSSVIRHVHILVSPSTKSPVELHGIEHVRRQNVGLDARLAGEQQRGGGSTSTGSVDGTAFCGARWTGASDGAQNVSEHLPARSDRWARSRQFDLANPPWAAIPTHLRRSLRAGKERDSRHA